MKISLNLSVSDTMKVDFSLKIFKFFEVLMFCLEKSFFSFQFENLRTRAFKLSECNKKRNKPKKIDHTKPRTSHNNGRTRSQSSDLRKIDLVVCFRRPKCHSLMHRALFCSVSQIHLMIAQERNETIISQIKSKSLNLMHALHCQFTQVKKI